MAAGRSEETEGSPVGDGALPHLAHSAEGGDGDEGCERRVCDIGPKEKMA